MLTVVPYFKYFFSTGDFSRISLTEVDQIRPPQDADVLPVQDFQIPCFRPETHQSRRPWTKIRTSATTSGTGTRASKFQDGEDVDVLRSLGSDIGSPDILVQLSVGQEGDC